MTSDAPPSGRSIAVTNRHPRLRVDRPAVAGAIRMLDKNHAAIRAPRTDFLRGDLSIVLLTDPALARLHGEFLDDPTITDVITFEGDAQFGLAGEICVSADAAARVAGLAGAKGSSPAFNRELTLYLVHGWLHLAGYDDLRPDRKRTMRRAEARAMTILERARAIPRFALRPSSPPSRQQR